MPPRRNAKKRIKLKQKKAVSSRLFQISLTIDRCVYKNKAISAADAENYIQEISAYKPQCAGDERCLQVIEKITRCMTAIIAEQEENNKMIIDAQAVDPQTYCPSPVYSLIDDDDETTAIPNFDNRDTYETNIDIIELSDDEVMMPKQMLVDVEIHRAMSNLSVRDDKSLSEDTPVASQSILDNSNINMTLLPVRKIPIASKDGIINGMDNNVKNSKHDVLQNTVVVNKIKEIAKDENKILAQRVAKNVATTIISKPNPLVQNKSVHFKDTSDDNIITTTTGKPDDDKPKKRAAKENQYDDKKIKKNAKGRRNTKASTQSKKNEKTIAKTTNSAANSHVTLNNNKETVHDKTDANKSNTNNDNSQIHLTKKQKNILTGKEHTQTDKALHKIYNSAVENDLSWIENIRFVREIDTTEYQSVSISHSLFWDNFEFPEKWNDNDWDEI